MHSTSPGVYSRHRRPAAAHLPNSEVSASRCLRIKTNGHGRVAVVPVRRNLQVQRCRLPGEYPARQIELGTVTRTEQAAQPLVAQVRRSHFRTISRYTAQVGTDTHKHSKLRPQGAGRPTDVLRLLAGCRRLRIFQSRSDLLDILEHLWGTPDNPNRFTTPLYGDLLAWLNLVDVDGYRCTRCFRFRTGIPGRYERNGCTDDADTTYHRRGTDQKSAPALAHVAITHYGFLPSGEAQMRKTRLCASKRTSQPENVSAEMVMKLPTAYKPEWRLACLIPAPDQKYFRQPGIASRVRRYRLIPLTEPYIRATYTAHAINLPRTRGQ